MAGGKPFEKGNQFWKQRSKHGKDKLFASPELLWEAACEYFKWCDENPHLESKPFAYQGEISLAVVPKMRAYTMGGLCLYLGCNEAYFRIFKGSLRENSHDYNTIIALIEDTITEQQFSGAASDLLNANIIARKQGLAEKMNTDITVNEIRITRRVLNSKDDKGN